MRKFKLKCFFLNYKKNLQNKTKKKNNEFNFKISQLIKKRKIFLEFKKTKYKNK